MFIYSVSGYALHFQSVIIIIFLFQAAKTFDVTPERTETLLRIGAQDVCRLYIETTEIVLALTSTGALLARWPLQCLRRYSCDQGVFSFEAGRKAPLGEGKYSFRTDEDTLVFDTLEHMVKSRASTLPRNQLQRPSEQQAVNKAVEDDEHQYNTLQFLRGPDALVQSPVSSISSTEAGYARLASQTFPPSAVAHNQYDLLNRGETELGEEYDQINNRFKGMDPDAEYTYAYTGAIKPPPLPPTERPKRSAITGYEKATHSKSVQQQTTIPPKELSLSLPPDCEVPETGCYETAVVSPDPEL